ncbi:hypothetical protein EPUS_00427 [Endocarpon pusillum Z07020]|uniref:Peptidase M20 dimerisation domain-containing protein n=1 Tax=Endocarpon pusillum (strain Z07020 / HMAS-L-300199) TaxID=1263415 RepID=U1HMK1_ENDPU|nr:uncharacterized protein EPUS_00427 [Endocarpon pusillum Z07020]ERF70239.1 hypothetical protein EPUS_00427 [Endocarpon pusillum Z07020]
MILKDNCSSFCLFWLLLPPIPLAQASNRIHDQSPLSQDPISEVISASPLLSFHRSLCQTESISNNENAVGNYLFSYLKKHHFHVLRQEVPQPADSTDKKKRFNVFAWPKADINASTPILDLVDEEKDDVLGDFVPKVILTSHIDTVPPFIPYSTSIPPSSLPGEEEEEAFNRSAILLSGRGTVDAKACVAAQTHAVLDLLSSPLAPNLQQQQPPPSFPANTEHEIPTLPTSLPVALLFVVGEETTGSGMKTFSSSALHRSLSHPPNPPDRPRRKAYSTLIFGEPTQSRLPSGHKGILVFRILAHGKAAHSGYPWLGRSANSLIIPVLAAMDGLGDVSEEAGGLPRSAKYGASTVNVGLIRGGVAANVVPERAEASVAVRLAGGYPPIDLDADVDGFGESETVNYGTDVPNLDLGSRSGQVKRYLYGPGSILVAHGDHEGLTVGELEGAVAGYRRLILAALER